jgi:ankyrin repeat protein
MVKYLLSKGANKKIKANNGMTPLDIAKKNKNKKIIALLKDGK